MSTIDIIILIVFVVAIVYGLYKGVIAQLGSLGGIILGIVACRLFSGGFARLLGTILPNMASDASTSAYINNIIANVIIFVLVYVLAVLLAKLLKKITHALMLGVFDRILGAIFGLFKCFLVFSIVVNVWIAFDSDAKFVQNSKLVNGVAAKAIVDLAPTTFGLANDAINTATSDKNKK